MHAGMQNVPACAVVRHAGLASETGSAMLTTARQLSWRLASFLTLRRRSAYPRDGWDEQVVRCGHLAAGAVRHLQPHAQRRSWHVPRSSWSVCETRRTFDGCARFFSGSLGSRTSSSIVLLRGEIQQPNSKLPSKPPAAVRTDGPTRQVDPNLGGVGGIPTVGRCLQEKLQHTFNFPPLVWQA